MAAHPLKSARLAVAIENAVSTAKQPRMFKGFRLQSRAGPVDGHDAHTLLVKDELGQIFLVRVNRYA